ncbi:MAG: hypothetical protein JW809_16225 [Pirellulales bacterium]|nr:hypothetical protein [Pirellulales bacterium]
MNRRKHAARAPVPVDPPAPTTTRPIPTRAQRALLAASAALLVGWIAFLVVLAAGG